MTPELLAKYAGPVPRYTSYPTAPHFGPDVDADLCRQWLAAVDPDEVLSLYIHVPFCQKLCWFCGCNTTIANHYQPVADYLDLLTREIEMVASIFETPRPASHIHFGGGSPTIVEPEHFRSLMDLLRRHFTIAEDAEIAIEIDPRTVTEQSIAALAAAGTTRASLGIQDFDPAVQRAVNRLQPYEFASTVVDQLRSAGIERINIDLMYGLPYQTADGLAGTVERALSLAPDRVAVFGYAHVPWMKPHQRLIDESKLPDARERWQQSETVAAELTQAGYVAVGLDHFARSDDPMAKALKAGKLRRNFQGYGTDTASSLVGFGASAISTLPQGYTQNEPHLRDYLEAIDRLRLATRRGLALDDDDRLRGEIIERLMCDLTVDLDDACKRRGREVEHFDDALASLAAMRDDGLVEIDRHRIAVTETGRPLVRRVCAAFDSYLVESEARHSSAV